MFPRMMNPFHVIDAALASPVLNSKVISGMVWMTVGTALPATYTAAAGAPANVCILMAGLGAATVAALRWLQTK